MFTGIIEEIGTISRIQRIGQSRTIEIHAQKILADLKVGDSIAVNGVCLTVLKFNRNSFIADISTETLLRSTFSVAKVGDKVNLERAMLMQDRLSGHFVTGHVDSTGKIRKLKPQQNWVDLEITVAPEFMQYIVSKGSIAVDGISLTIVDILRDSFSIAVIPFTAQQTTLGSKSVGNLVNLEYDLLAKFIVKQISKIKQK